MLSLNGQGRETIPKSWNRSLRFPCVISSSLTDIGFCLHFRGSDFLRCLNLAMVLLLHLHPNLQYVMCSVQCAVCQVKCARWSAELYVQCLDVQCAVWDNWPRVRKCSWWLREGSCWGRVGPTWSLAPACKQGGVFPCVAGVSWPRQSSRHSCAINTFLQNKLVILRYNIRHVQIWH